jgi:hypothetical protein
MAAPAHNRTQAKVLATLRGILRHVRQNLDTRAEDGIARDTRDFHKCVVAQFREGRGLASRADVKAARGRAADVLECLQAVKAQQVRVQLSAVRASGLRRSRVALGPVQCVCR